MLNTNLFDVIGLHNRYGIIEGELLIRDCKFLIQYSHRHSFILQFPSEI